MVLQRAPQRAIVWGYADTFNIPITLTMNNQVYHTISSSTLSACLTLSGWMLPFGNILSIIPQDFT
jgi:hypothetical protein